MALKLFICLALSLIVGDASANKYLRQAAETKGVFPVLEAKSEYEVNKREFTKRQSSGEVAADCKPCPPFDPEAIEKGETHCAPGLKPVKRCDAKCGCESWDCVRENCDVWIKANAKNFTGPCVNEASGEVDACITRTRVEWNCGCKVMTCEKDCYKSRGPLPKDFECDEDCSTPTFDQCKCQLPTCKPLPVPTPPGGLCGAVKDCPNPDCSNCEETKPFGEKCAKQFPKEHVVGECKPKPAPKSPCDICKNELTVEEGKDDCGHPKFACAKKPSASTNGTCEYCEKSIVVEAQCENNEMEGKKVLCDQMVPLPTQPPCKEPDCDYCTQIAVQDKMAPKTRCPGCPSKICKSAPTKAPQKIVPESCCNNKSGIQSGSFKKLSEHPKCDKTVCVQDCEKSKESQKCDACTEQMIPTGKADDCGCKIYRCVKIVTPEPAPKDGCEDCLKEVVVPMNPANNDCKKVVKTCVKKTAVYQIVSTKDDLKVPEDPADPLGKDDDKKKDLFELADEKTVKEMDPESFEEALKELPEGEPALLQDGKVVVKTPSGSSTTPSPGEPGKPTIFTVEKTPEDVKVEDIKKVFVFIPNTCPAVETPSSCHIVERKSKLCDCQVHKEVVNVTLCIKEEECPTKCVKALKPIAPEGHCNATDKICAPICEEIGPEFFSCDDKDVKTTAKLVDCAPPAKGKKSCTQKKVTTTVTMDTVTIPGTRAAMKCCKKKEDEGLCQCKTLECDPVCERRIVVTESNDCGCAEYKCVPAPPVCDITCKFCEKCVAVEDAVKKCKKYECIPAPKPVPNKCERYKETVPGSGILDEDDCLNPIVEKDCPAKMTFAKPCPKGQYSSKVVDGCFCSLCTGDHCCAECPPAKKGLTCDACEVKEITEATPGCPVEKCTKKVCAPIKTPNCPKCDKAIVKKDKCGCEKIKCVPRSCAPIDKSRCKPGEKLAMVTNECGCTGFECTPAETCRAECKPGEEAKQQQFICKEVMTPCRIQRSQALSKLKMGIVGIFAPECDDAGHFSAVQKSGALQYCVNKQTGAKIAGTEGPIGSVKC